MKFKDHKGLKSKIIVKNKQLQTGIKEQVILESRKQTKYPQGKVWLSLFLMEY